MKCKDCNKRIWKNWQKWCSVQLEKEEQFYDYHKKCFKEHHYNKWSLFHPELVPTAFSGEKIPVTGFYKLTHHRETCDKALQAEHKLFLCKNSIAPHIIVCGHEVAWKCVGEF